MWAKHISSYRHVRPFLIIIGAFLTLLVGGFTLYLHHRTDRLVTDRLHEQATAYHDLIMHSKEWNAAYGGVYVEKKGGVATNPYLRQTGIEPDLRLPDGRAFTLRNHAIMIAEISRMSEKGDGVKFRLTSLAPLDPDNAPDGVERDALHRFAAGDAEFARLTSAPPRAYRFIRPLYAEQSCLECHKGKGFAIGSVLGAISVNLPAGAMLAESRANKLLLIAWAAATICILLASTYFLTWRLSIKLDEVQLHLVQQASTDELTGLMNRRNILKRFDEELQRALRRQDRLCIMIIDLDHFKRINDSYGHLFGDVVLKSAAACIREVVRTYDIIGRIGGEEFLIISPGVEMELAVSLAERVRGRVSELEFQQGEERITVTLSVGVTSLESGDLGLVSMMKRADRALYQAKEQGRNRVVAL